MSHLKCETTETGLYNRLVCITYCNGTGTEHGLTAATAESWCHHLLTYCVDRGLVDGAPAGVVKNKSKKSLLTEVSLCQNFEHVGGF